MTLKRKAAVPVTLMFIAVPHAEPQSAV